MTAIPSWEWTYLRGAFLALASVLLLQVAGWLVYEAVHEETPPLELTVRCLTREKLLEVQPTNDPIAQSAREGSIGTRVEGNGVHVAIAASGSEADMLVEYYTSVAGDLMERLEKRGKVVYVWEGIPTPTQRQIMYDCFYD